MGTPGGQRSESVLEDERVASSPDLRRGSDSDRRRRALETHDPRPHFSLIDALPHLVWTTDSAGDCDFVSRPWIDYTGAPLDAHLGRGWLDCAHPDDRELATAAWQQALRAGETVRFELRLKRHDGVFRWFEAHAVPVRDSEGRIMKWCGSSTDIDERKRLDELRLRAQKLEALGTLAGGIAHDFNNILMAIAGNAKLAMPDLPGDHPAQECLQEIERASTRATSLVGRILAWTRQREPNREVVVLEPLIEATLARIRSTLPPTVELTTRFAPEVPTTVTGVDEVEQIIVDLVSNSVQAIGTRPGRIVIELNPALESEVRSAGLDPGAYALLSVRDDGCGMDSWTLERIFDPFFSTKAMGQGSGLGLSVVDGIMKSNGGAIMVTSKVGLGTIFRLYFKAKEGPTASSSHRTVRARRGHGERVMYVDDEDALVRIATRGLTRLGFAVAAFSDPAVALERFKAEPFAFDVVISDVSMPTMSGFDLARELLAMRPDLPIVLTSGYAPTDILEEVHRMGVREMLMKPNTIDELGRVISRLLQGGAPLVSP